MVLQAWIFFSRLVLANFNKGLKIESRVTIYAQWDFHEKQPETISVSFKSCFLKTFLTSYSAVLYSVIKLATCF